MTYSLKRLFVLVSIAAVICGLARVFYLELTRIEVGENVPSVSWLPKTATNVSYYRSYAFTAYEYEIAEDEFMKRSSRKLGAIDGTVSVPRFCIRSRVPELGPNPTIQEMQIQAEAVAARTAHISDGWYYSSRFNNGGGVISAYDRRLKRAYFWSAPR